MTDTAIVPVLSNKYQVMPPLTDEEFAGLKASIEEKGVTVPIDIEEEGCPLDGYHRLKAWADLDKPAADIPHRVIRGLDEAGKRAHARRLNMLRRHMNQEQKREQIKQYLADNPDVSSRSAAAALGVSHTTVETVRNEAPPSPPTGQVGQLNGEAPTPTPQATPLKRIGKDGKGRKVGPKSGNNPVVPPTKIETNLSSEKSKLGGLNTIWGECTDGTKADFKRQHREDFGLPSILECAVVDDRGPRAFEPSDLVKELYEWASTAAEKEYPLNVAKGIAAKLDLQASSELGKLIGVRIETLEAKAKGREAV
jgi:hypothetical protein